MNRRTSRRAVLVGTASALTFSSIPAWAAPRRRVPWEDLRKAVGAAFVPVKRSATTGIAVDQLIRDFRNPYFLRDNPLFTQTMGWDGAWWSEPSEFAVAAETANDVAAAVSFARRHNVRLVVRGAGHSYFGNSNAKDSLLIWTRNMEQIRLVPKFLPAGAPLGTVPIQAVSVEAGAIWGRVYDEVAKAGRYVQGGGCLTVGVAGFALGGGFGAFSKAFGTGAANLLEAEIVTADGRVRQVSEFRDPDLFFALRGGGGGTYGVVTRLAFRTHALPSTIGGANVALSASDDQGWTTLVREFLRFYADNLMNEHWGEQVRFRPGRRLGIRMMFQGLEEQAAKGIWSTFLADASRIPGVKVDEEPQIVAAPAERFWDPSFLRTLPGVVLTDDRQGAPPENVYWSGDRDEAGQVLHAYQSIWLSRDLLQPDSLHRLASALVEGSSHWPVALHFNKGLAGARAEALARTGETATNPDVLDAFALAICAANAQPAPDATGRFRRGGNAAASEAARVARAFKPVEALANRAGTYMSEANYFGTDWEAAYWGKNYSRLLSAKRKYDPNNLFHGHHTVGSS